MLIDINDIKMETLFLVKVVLILVFVKLNLYKSRKTEIIAHNC